MSLPEYTDVTARATAGPAFSNGTEYDAWWEQHCAGCVNEEDCPLLAVALFEGVTPAEWQPDKPGYLGEQYSCTLFRAQAGDG